MCLYVYKYIYNCFLMCVSVNQIEWVKDSANQNRLSESPTFCCAHKPAGRPMYVCLYVYMCVYLGLSIK